MPIYNWAVAETLAIVSASSYEWNYLGKSISKKNYNGMDYRVFSENNKLELLVLSLILSGRSLFSVTSKGSEKVIYTSNVVFVISLTSQSIDSLSSLSN